jgi:cytochrome bd ubiquinol oxidase subunit II
MDALLPQIWLSIIGFFLMYYAVTDGFDLGIGIMALFSRKAAERGLMMDSISGIWHINQTWLVVLGGMLFGAFPQFYSILFSALYIPSMLMLVGFVLRGIAFDFREQAFRQGIWESIFGIGSLITTMAQGFALGGLLSGLTVKNGQFAGSVWEWLNPFSGLVALGVLLGYLMLGANYLILKTEKEIQERTFRQSLFFSSLTLLVSLSVHLWIQWKYPHSALKWVSFPDFYVAAVFPLLAAAAFFFLFRSLWKRQERAPLFWNIVLILFSFLGVSVDLYPQMIPNVVSPVTVAEGSASPQTLLFMLIVMAILIPLIVFYTSYTYKVFSGKIKGTESYE